VEIVCLCDNLLVRCIGCVGVCVGVCVVEGKDVYDVVKMYVCVCVGGDGMFLYEFLGAFVWVYESMGGGRVG